MTINCAVANDKSLRHVSVRQINAKMKQILSPMQQIKFESISIHSWRSGESDFLWCQFSNLINKWDRLNKNDYHIRRSRKLPACKHPLAQILHLKVHLELETSKIGNSEIFKFNYLLKRI